MSFDFNDFFKAVGTGKRGHKAYTRRTKSGKLVRVGAKAGLAKKKRAQKKKAIAAGKKETLAEKKAPQFMASMRDKGFKFTTDIDGNDCLVGSTKSGESVTVYVYQNRNSESSKAGAWKDKGSIYYVQYSRGGDHEFGSLKSLDKHLGAWM